MKHLILFLFLFSSIIVSAQETTKANPRTTLQTEESGTILVSETVNGKTRYNHHNLDSLLKVLTTDTSALVLIQNSPNYIAPPGYHTFTFQRPNGSTFRMEIPPTLYSFSAVDLSSNPALRINGPNFSFVEIEGEGDIEADFVNSTKIIIRYTGTDDDTNERLANPRIVGDNLVFDVVNIITNSTNSTESVNISNIVGTNVWLDDGNGNASITGRAKASHFEGGVDVKSTDAIYRTILPADGNYYSAGTTNGIIQVELPSNNSNYMGKIEISMSTYNNVGKDCTIIIPFWNHPSSHWSGTHRPYVVAGIDLGLVVRLGISSNGRDAIVIQTPSNFYSNLGVGIEKVEVRRQLNNAWQTGWTTSIISDLTGFTEIQSYSDLLVHAENSNKLEGSSLSYVLDYNNHTNKPSFTSFFEGGNSTNSIKTINDKSIEGGKFIGRINPNNPFFPFPSLSLGGADGGSIVFYNNDLFTGNTSGEISHSPDNGLSIESPDNIYIETPENLNIDAEINVLKSTVLKGSITKSIGAAGTIQLTLAESRGANKLYLTPVPGAVVFGLEILDGGNQSNYDGNWFQIINNSTSETITFMHRQPSAPVGSKFGGAASPGFFTLGPEKSCRVDSDGIIWYSDKED